MSQRCEDYPCCGHTDGLGCNWTPESVYSDPHLFCDHNTGYCEIEDANDDDYDDEDAREQAEIDAADAKRENDMFDVDHGPY